MYIPALRDSGLRIIKSYSVDYVAFNDIFEEWIYRHWSRKVGLQQKGTNYGSNLIVAYFCKQRFTGTQLHSFILAAFVQ